MWCFENGIEFSGYGSWTLKSEGADHGVEPDECYVFGNVPEPERPDLAIEVVWTSGGINKLETTAGSAYAKFGFGAAERSPLMPCEATNTPRCPRAKYYPALTRASS